jgi:hypothetical protein
MPRPLLGHQQLVANWDPVTDHIEMIGMVPGPAGIASLELDELTVEIDVANPASVAFISIPAVSTLGRTARLRDLLAQLIGSTSSVAVLDISSSPDAARVVVGGGATTQPGPREQVRPEVAALAIGLTQASTPGLRPAERAIALLEAVSLAGQANLLAHMTWLTGEVENAVTQLEESGIDELSESGTELSRSMGTICTEVSRYVASPEAASRLLAFAERLSSVRIQGGVRERWTGDVERIELAEVSPDSLTFVSGAPDLELRHTEADEFEARITDWSDRSEGWWVRAFSADGETPIAMAPLLPDGGDALAHLLIPSAHQNRLQIDVVNEPLQDRLSPAAIAFRAAIINGQRAARYQRLGRTGEAVEAWTNSEQWHRVAGDERRARQAGAIARQRSSISQPPTSDGQPPVITDHLDAARRERRT